MLYTSSGALPKHIYCYVDSKFIRKEKTGYEKCVWFGLSSVPGRAWGLHVMLECGAVYRNIPPHAISFFDVYTDDKWTISEAQEWDCYGTQFSTIIYPYLDGMEAFVKTEGVELNARYLFTAIPIGDGFTNEPTQSKEFMFMETEGGRLTIQPTDRVLFYDKSFVDDCQNWPNDLKPQTQVWRSEGTM